MMEALEAFFSGTMVSDLIQWLVSMDSSFWGTALVLLFWYLRQPKTTMEPSLLYKLLFPETTVAEATPEEPSPRKTASCSQLPSLEDPLWPSESTMAERERFASGGGRVATSADRLRQYLEWRQQHKTIEDRIMASLELTGDDDYDDWVISVAVARTARNEDVGNLRTVPRVVREYVDKRDETGRRFVHVLPGRIDESIVSLKAYSLAVGLYVDRKLDPAVKEDFTLVVDVRSGIGWPNKNGVQLLGFSKDTVSLLLANFPERLFRCIVYPVPSMFMWVWHLIRRCLGEGMAKRITVLTGPSTKFSPAPEHQLQLFFEPEIVDMLENTRKSMFL